MARLIPRLAGYDRNGNPVLDTDVLDGYELALDRGWVDPEPSRPFVADPGLVAEVVALQAGAA